MKKMYIFGVICTSLVQFIGTEIALALGFGIGIIGFIEGERCFSIIITICSIMLLKILSEAISETILDGVNNLKHLED